MQWTFKVVCHATHWSSLQETGDLNIFTNVQRFQPPLEWFQAEIRLSDNSVPF